MYSKEWWQWALVWTISTWASRCHTPNKERFSGGKNGTVWREHTWYSTRYFAGDVSSRCKGPAFCVICFFIMNSVFGHPHFALWWRHLLETSPVLLALCVGNSPVTGEFPSQRPVRWSFDIFFGLRLNKRFGKKSRRRRFETPSRSLWRHCIQIYISLNYSLVTFPLYFYGTIREKTCYIYKDYRRCKKMPLPLMAKFISVTKRHTIHII